MVHGLAQVVEQTGALGQRDLLGGQVQLGGQQTGDTKVDGDASDTTGLKQVKVGDRTLCEDTTVESNLDDWNGYREDLAMTGMAIGGVLLSIIAFGGVGVTLLGARRRTSTVKHGVHAAK